MAVRTAVIPAAGAGTRFLPITKSIPKVMLPLVDRPLLQYSVEEAVEAGIDRIILVTSPGQESTEDYFDFTRNLEGSLRSKNSPKLEELLRVSRMADIVAVRQPEPLGLGHAILVAQQAVGNEPFVIYLPDVVIRAEPSVTQQMLEVFEKHGSVVGVEEVAPERVSAYGIIEGEPITPDLWRLTHMVEKPPVDEAPSNMALVGRYIFTPAIFDCLACIPTGAIGELQLTDAISLLAQRESVHAYRFAGTSYDCGTPLGLLKASVAFGLQRSEYTMELAAWLKSLDGDLFS